MAAAKFEIYNADGSVQFSTANRLYRLLTVATAGASNGSVVAAGLSGNTPLISVEATDQDKKTPTTSVSGNTVSWSYGSTPSSVRDTNARILVGVY